MEGESPTLNIENTTDSDNSYAKRIYSNFEIKNAGRHHDLYLKSDTLLLADVFQDFRKMCLEIDELDPQN